MTEAGPKISSDQVSRAPLSSGFLHLKGCLPPTADRVEDVRDRRRDPAAARDILDLDGLDPRVQQIVLNTPGARELIANLADYADLPAGPGASPPDVPGVGTGHPFSPKILARERRDRGHQVEVEHRHVHLPRVLRSNGS
ncbi:hypothetical protein ABTY61_22880 [Kitasatospora sp. NPDC096128]|uniref:hypothetical protein n=1 Tax=Kitasatospora sp. NPDC096128 TaxID=3155547 RepID=UPI003319CE58